MNTFTIGDLTINMNPTFKELGAKSVLYKYRDWSDEYHKKLITEPSVYLSSPKEFKDPLDCLNPTRYDLLTDSQIFLRFYEHSKKVNPHISYKEHFDYAYYLFSTSPIRNPIEYYIIENRLNSEFNDRFGVLSVSENPHSQKMWEEYGASNQGFCVGYDSEKLFNFLGGGCKVTYVDELPRINPFEDFKIQHFKQVFFKTKKWKFEEEYRLDKLWTRKVSIEERNILISKDCIVEVLLGYKMSKEDKAEIKSIISKDLPKAKVIELTKKQII